MRSVLAEVLDQTRAKRPMLHCIANLVSANDCANLVLASGALPIMAEDPDEVEEIAAACGGLVLNLGTPSPRKIEALLRAGRTANRLGRPLVLDPVGAGSSQLRKRAAKELLEQLQCTVIRGNAGEIRTLVRGDMTRRGVDADEIPLPEETALAQELARLTGAVIVLTGAVDIVTDGGKTFRVRNGHPMMRCVTGTGCQLSSLIGAYVAANPADPLLASLAAVCAMGLCGELAHERLGALDGNASYRNYIIDALYCLDGQSLEKGARYEVC